MAKEDAPPFVRYMASTGSPCTFGVVSEWGEFATWEDFAAAHPGANEAEQKFAHVGCDRCDWSILCDVFHETNPVSPLSADGAIALLAADVHGRFSRSGPTTVRCRACTAGEFNWIKTYRLASESQRATRVEVIRVWRALNNELHRIGIKELVRLEGDETKAVFVFPPSGSGGLSWLVNVADGPLNELARVGGAQELVRVSRDEVSAPSAG